jgi:Acyl-CoA dehydrogenase, C-terminal domain
VIDADDLSLLAASFAATMAESPGAGAADAALHELGWADLLDAAPMPGAAAAFTALGATGAAACLLDDVVAHALGLRGGLSMCVVLPAPHSAVAAGLLVDGRLIIDGLVSARIDSATRAIVPVAGDGATTAVSVDAAHVRRAGTIALDADRPYRRAGAELDVSEALVVELTGTWDIAVRNARAAVAHQLNAASRGMLEQARRHAVDRIQFGRPIASFQAIRHKLADSLVAIEAAAAVAGGCTEACDPLMAAAAKSLAGKAAHVTATHTQQVLAGIGFTTDHPFHRSLKRTMVLDTLFGSAATLPTEIGLALLARRGAPRLIEL